MPKGGKIKIGTEYISYWGMDVDQNALKINFRGADGTTVQNHATGTRTHLHHARYAGGCTDLELVVTQGWNYVPASYHSCGTKDWRYEGQALRPALRLDNAERSARHVERIEQDLGGRVPTIRYQKERRFRQAYAGL